jgi:acetyl esterase/lipase
MKKSVRYCLAAVGLAATFTLVRGKDVPLPEGIMAKENLDYGGAKNPRQMLDLYLPKQRGEKPLPLIVWIHGGAWEGGSKDDAKVIYPFLKSGKYAGASIGYRLTKEAKWPAQAHDVKAALRWIQANGAAHGIDTQKVALFGISAGGHLVSLLGTTADTKDLEVDIGGAGSGPNIRCVINFCGPANFLTFPNKGSIINEEEENSCVARLFGGPMSKHLPAAKAASPVTYVSKADPPFLHIHGTKDPLVPYAQVQEFDAALDKAGVSSTVLTGEGAGHVFFSNELVAKMQAFLDMHLLGVKADIKEGPVATK